MEENSPVLDESGPEPSRRESGCYLPCRYALVILSSSGFCVLYLMRVNLSVAIVAMVNSTYADAKASANNPECQRDTVKTTRIKVSLVVLEFVNKDDFTLSILYVSIYDRLSTGQEMVQGKQFFKVRERSRNFILSQGNLTFWRKVREII